MGKNRGKRSESKAKKLACIAKHREEKNLWLKDALKTQNEGILCSVRNVGQNEGPMRRACRLYIRGRICENR